MAVDLSEKAETYIEDLRSGAIAPHSDRFVEVMEFLRKLRKSGASDPRGRELYCALADLFRQSLCDEVSAPLAGPIQPIYSGQVHLFAGTVEKDGKEWFVKAVSSNAASELAAARALMDGKLARAGRHYAFSVPHSIVLTNNLTTYLSPALLNPTPLRQTLAEDPNDVLKIVRALAELNASLGGFARDDCPALLDRARTSLGELKKERLRAVFAQLDPDSLDRLHENFLKIQANWPRIEARLNKTTWGLAHGDLASNNGTVLKKKLMFFDLGQLCFAPIGSDLYWLLYNNRGNPEHVRYVVSEYCKELQGHGLSVSEDEVRANAYARYAQKWLFPSKRGTASSIHHIRTTQDIALTMLQDEVATQA